MMQSLKGIYIRIGATCSEIDMRKITFLNELEVVLCCVNSVV